RHPRSHHAVKINPEHWLEGVTHDEIAGGSAMAIRRCLVIHFTSGATAKSSINFWRTPAAKGASAHIVIDRDGTIYQCRPFNRTCGHAGTSRWRDPKTGKLYIGVNTCGIGIELANAGNDPALASRWTKLPLVSSGHRNSPKTIERWEAFPAAQLAACTRVALAVVTRYQLDDITGHDCIAPERKNDPGPAFPMTELRKACGFTGQPAVHRV
ncbi:MAG: N-acetylmuramoyl-L-alanine amidase, partial [Chthoniobacteraceae bacterium]